MTAVDDAKRVMRTAARAKRKSLSPEDRARRSALICEHISGCERWSSASVVTAFLAIQSEVNLDWLLRSPSMRGKVLGLPRTVGDEMVFDAVDLSEPDALVVGEFNIMVARVPSPIPPADVELSLVPLLAFDADGNRLGAGRAFYDRWLAKAPNTFRLGVAFRAQEFPAVPVDGFDQKLHAIVTEDGLVEFTP